MTGVQGYRNSRYRPSIDISQAALTEQETELYFKMLKTHVCGRYTCV